MRFTVKLLAIAFISSIAFNCGGEEKKEEKEKVKIGAKKEVKEEDSNVANLVITADDNMQFNKSELKVKAGQRVKLTLRHIGKMEVAIMGHNVVILKEGTDVEEFSAKAATARDNDYIPEGTDAVIAHTKMIGGGQVTTIEFDAPAVGSYDYICSFPAHYALMKGKLIVE
ncbi:MAG: azurin [bacterium]